MAVRLEVCIMFIMVMFVASAYTLCGCTKGGTGGVLEGITSAIDSASNPKKKCGSNSSGYEGGGWADIFTDFFGGGTTSGFDNMGKYFSDISFGTASKDNPDPGMQDFFAGVSFSSKCCPSRYSTDTGCACLNQSKYDVIRSRGGNNMPVSQW